MASLVLLIGILSSLEIFNGGFAFTQMLFFTFWANFLTFLFFISLTIKSGINLKLGGKFGNCFFYSKIYGTLMVAMILVMLAFWIGIAPFVENTHELWRFSNFATHVINPIIIITDYVLFSKAGFIAVKDPLLYLVFPGIYGIAATVMGFSGVEFVSPYFDYPHAFPYPFMNWHDFGALTSLMLLAAVVIFAGTGYALYAIDKKRAGVVANSPYSQEVEVA